MKINVSIPTLKKINEFQEAFYLKILPTPKVEIEN